ncbi:MAG TPA: MFS transporter [Gemmatimonadaceae bacterium]|nr:MFS transporter [Gemmatimonadaceae bacterium]
MKRLLLTGTTLGFVVVQLDVTIVNVALQRIGQSLGGNVASLQWIVNAYTLVFAALILTAGALGDRLGARRVFIAGFAIFGLGSLGCALSTSTPILIGARALQGIGAAILVPCSLALINHAYTTEAERNKAISIWAAGASVAVAAGPVIGGVLIAFAGWRSIFYVNVPLAIVGIFLVWRYSQETPRLRQRSIDLPGQLLGIFALADIAFTIIERAGVWGYVLFAVAAIAFLIVESRSPSPMLPLGLFRNATFSATTVIGWVINVAFYGLIFVLSLFFQRTLKYSALQTGLAFLPMTGMILPANLASGAIATRVGPRIPIVVGQIAMIVGCLALLVARAGTPYWQLAPQMLLLGGGVGLVVPAMTSALLGTVDKSRSGVASGVLNASRQAGSVVGVALFGNAGLTRDLLIAAGIVLPGVVIALRFLVKMSGAGTSE